MCQQCSVLPFLVLYVFHTYSSQNHARGPYGDTLLPRSPIFRNDNPVKPLAETFFFFFKKVPIKHQKTVYVCVSACFIVLRNAEFLTFNSPMCNRWEYLSRISIYHCNNSSWIGLCTPTFWRAGDVIFAHFIYPGALSHVHKHGHFRMIFFFLQT